jgi:hypothetical protein
VNTCGTCKHFGRALEFSEYDDDHNETIITKFHACKLLKHMNNCEGHKYDGVAGPIDGSGYHAVFCVSEEFGCNQWEPKP